MKDRKGNRLRIGDRIKVLLASDNREYEGKVISIKGDIALISAKGYFVYVNNPDRILKMPFDKTGLLYYGA